MFPRGSACVYIVHVVKTSTRNCSAKTRRSMFCLCNPYVVSLLEAVRWHHCFGLIHMFTCITIIINVYGVRMLLITRLSYTIFMYKIKSRK